MYSYREYMALQSSAFMTGDDKLEKKNLDTMRYLLTTPKKLSRPEPTAAADLEAEAVKIYEPGRKTGRE